MVDDNEFFRSATLTICGSLDVHTAMAKCASYMQAFLPVDRIFLQLYEPDIGAMRTIAMATAEEGKQVDILTPMPEAARRRLDYAVREMFRDFPQP